MKDPMKEAQEIIRNITEDPYKGETKTPIAYIVNLLQRTYEKVK